MKKKSMMIVITTIVLAVALLGACIFYLHIPHDGALKSAEQMLYDRFGEPHTASNKEVLVTRYYNYFTFQKPDAVSVYQNGKTVKYTGASPEIEQIYKMCRQYVMPSIFEMETLILDWIECGQPATADQMNQTIWHATCVLLTYDQRQKYISDIADYKYATGHSNSKILNGMEYDALLILLAQDGTVQIIPCIDGKYLFEAYSVYKAEVDEKKITSLREEYRQFF